MRYFYASIMIGLGQFSAAFCEVCGSRTAARGKLSTIGSVTLLVMVCIWTFASVPRLLVEVMRAME